MTVAVYTKAITYITVLPAVAAGFACGVFLFFIAVVGLYGVIQHNQAVLFFVSFYVELLSHHRHRRHFRYHSVQNTTAARYIHKSGMDVYSDCSDKC